MANHGTYNRDSIFNRKIIEIFPLNFQSEFTVEQIDRYLRRFGEITSIELLKNRENEAYVTFASDKSAYLAQLQYEFDRESKKPLPMYIEPADSWQQPSTESSNQENQAAAAETESEIFTLNEDCLLHLCTFLDLDSLVNLSEVCKLFHNLLHRHSFSRFRRFDVNNSGGCVSMPLRKMRRTLRCIGPHIVELNYQNSLRQKKFLQMLAEYIGPNLRRAQFRNSSLCEDNRIFVLAPILRPVEYLEIYDFDYNQHDEIDFEAICPNLIELNLKVNMRLDLCCKPWTKLQRLNIMNNERLHTHTFVALVEQNPQITVLEFSTFESDTRLQAIAANLPQLQKLTLDSLDWNLAGWHLVHLIGLQHLTEINLQTLDYQHLRGIFDGLATVKQLERISLHAYRPEDEAQDGEQDYERSMVDVARQLPNLCEFSIKSIAVTDSNLVAFVRLADKLKTLHVHSCLIICDALILDIANVLTLYRSSLNNDVRPLLMFVNPDNLLNLNVRRNVDVWSKVRVDVRCRHCGF